MAWPALKRHFSQDQFGQYVSTLKWLTWRPSLIVLHNTAAPSLAQWHETSEKDRKAGKVPGTTRINNLENYWWKERRWTGCPHLVIPEDRIWVMNPLTAPGVHSPSWNHNSIGIEMVADFDREDDDSGDGLKVRRNAIFATAVLCTTLGLDPRTAVKLHRDDKKTTHACPGEDFARDRNAVLDEIESLMAGGEHGEHDIAIAIGSMDAPVIPERKGMVRVNDLNLRPSPGVTNKPIASLKAGTMLVIIEEAANASTPWLRVKTSTGKSGWVAGNYVTINK